MLRTQRGNARTPIHVALTVALAGCLLAGCPKSPGPDGPSGNGDGPSGTAAIPTGQPTATAEVEVPAPSATASADAPDEGDMTQAQSAALAALRAAMPQDPRKYDAAAEEVVRQVDAGEVSFVGLTRGQLTRALGKPNEPTKPRPNHASWTIGVLPVMPMHPPIFEVEFDDEGLVKATGIRRSM